MTPFLFIVCVLGCPLVVWSILAVQRAAGVNVRWDNGTKQLAWRLLLGGLTVGCLAGVWFFSLTALLSALPFLATMLIAMFITARGMDILYGDGTARHIVHANGRRAIVTKDHYRRLPETPAGPSLLNRIDQSLGLDQD